MQNVINVTYRVFAGRRELGDKGTEELLGEMRPETGCGVKWGGVGGKTHQKLLLVFHSWEGEQHAAARDPHLHSLRGGKESR